MEENLKDPAPLKFSVGDYQLLKLIGTGSIGSVYEAVDSKGAKGALKIMKPTPFFEAQMLECIVQGALLTRDIASHTKAVRTYDAGYKDGFFFISMEMLTGGTFEKVISDASMPLKTKLEKALSICETLSFLHSQGIIHGDLKPSNILLDSCGVPYLNDFYYASNSIPEYCKSFTFPGGTLRYMSPEQSQNKFLSKSTDIYSFGIILYELVTGKLPYATEPATIAEMLAFLKNGAITPPSRHRPMMSDSLEKTILKLIERLPENRFASMDEVKTALSQCPEYKGAPRGICAKLKSFFHMFINLFKGKA